MESVLATRTATSMRNSVARAWSGVRRRGDRHLAISHERLHVDTGVPGDPCDTALDFLRSFVVFERQARTRLRQANAASVDRVAV